MLKFISFTDLWQGFWKSTPMLVIANCQDMKGYKNCLVLNLRHPMLHFSHAGLVMNNGINLSLFTISQN